jgi:cyclopropane fatty-acyl-phospholipid synthase-like methyltransferase
VNHDKYGRVTYIRAPFHDIPLADSVADGVVSVSAIEHADIKLFRDNIDSLVRLLKPNAPMLLTTSATKEEKSLYNETVAGWCFSKDHIAELLPECFGELNGDACEQSLLSSTEFIRRINTYYFQRGQLFHDHKFSNLPYLPLAIKFQR